MDYELMIVSGRSAANTVKLADGVTTVGRHDDCQLRIKSSQVSRKHCEIFEKKGHLLIKDLGSSNGTFVNGKRLKDQRVLIPGDEITIGQVKFRVARIGAAPPAAAAGTKPSDTAVGEPVVVKEAPGDEFEIEFDDDTAMEPPVPAAGADELDFVEELEPASEPEPEPARPAAKPAKAAAPKAPAPAPAKAPEPEPAPQPEPEPALADDAVADFLLDIKLDDEE